jgi:hypothetical protein
VEVEVIEGERPLPLRLAHPGAERAVLAEPGRRYAAARGDRGFGGAARLACAEPPSVEQGFSPWEEISS